MSLLTHLFKLKLNLKSTSKSLNNNRNNKFVSPQLIFTPYLVNNFTFTESIDWLYFHLKNNHDLLITIFSTYYLSLLLTFLSLTFKTRAIIPSLIQVLKRFCYITIKLLIYYIVLLKDKDVVHPSPQRVKPLISRFRFLDLTSIIFSIKKNFFRITFDSVLIYFRNWIRKRERSSLLFGSL